MIVDLDRLLPSPARFLGAFALATGALLWAWGGLSGHYLAGLTWLVNRALELGGASLSLQAPRLGPADMAYPGVAAGIALFAVTPRRSGRWKLRWGAATLAVLGGLHAALLGMDALQVLLARRPGSAAAAAALLGHLSPLGRSWGTAAAILAVWFRAARSDEGRGLVAAGRPPAAGYSSMQ